MSRFFMPFFMKTINIYSQTHTFSSDALTPIGLYLALRNNHRCPFLLESNDYHSRSDSKSIIGLNPLITLSLYHSSLILEKGEEKQFFYFDSAQEALRIFQELITSVHFENPIENNGFVSYFSFEYAQFVEGKLPKEPIKNIPLAQMIVFEKIIVLDHFRDTGIVIQNQLSTDTNPLDLNQLLKMSTITPLPFETLQEESSSSSEHDCLHMVDQALNHIKRGNIFQLVVSRRFEQRFFGDDFEVYRTLRRLNPSPYLFYLDFEDFRLFGSSPETQITFKKGRAEIHPIAGTIKKSGDRELDQRAITVLKMDDKENAEHTMLVDLARNDLSKFSDRVELTSYKEIQHFSHVIHMVSKVIARTDIHPIKLFNGTFPAGTLSGTPKPKALDLIAELEPHPRGFYGGALGFISATGDANLAIIIRSALSQNNTLYYQAGAGIVLDSVPENELEEVNNKLGAIRSAIQQTQVKHYENSLY